MTSETQFVDYHIHSLYSFDCWEGRIFDICQAALKNGLSRIAVTDHLDANTADIDLTMKPDLKQLRREIYRAKDYYAGRLQVLFGIELGQPHQAPELSQKTLDENDFDYVIGSYHNNVGCEDFCCIDYPNTSYQEIAVLYENYLAETLDHLKWCNGKICTLGHLGYPLRYLAINGMSDAVDPFEPKYLSLAKEIFRFLIKHGIALEVNTSGLRQGLGATMPSDGMVQCYLDMGGKLVTVGSDSHKLAHVGCNIKDEYATLYRLGLRSIAAYSNHNWEFIDL